MSNTVNHPVHVTAETFQKEVIEAGMPVIVDFWAPWCGPCRAIGPILEGVAKQYEGTVKVAKVNVDEEPELASAFQVRSIPMLVAIEGQEIRDVQIGFGGPASVQRFAERLT